MKNILIVRSNPIAPDPRVEKIAAVLSSGGYRVHVLGWDRFGKSPVCEVREGILIQRLPIVAGFGKGIKNIGPLLRWQFALLAWLVKKRVDYDIVHACDFDTILPALLSKFLFRKKVVYDIFDFYADHLRATPKVVKQMIRRLDIWAINRADAVVLVDLSRKSQISGALPKRLEFIFNSPEDCWMPPDQPIDSEREPGLRLAYIGLLQVERGLLEILDVVERHPEWTFDIAGFGGDEETIQKKAVRLKNVRWHGRVSYERAMELSRQADVLFATYDPAIPNHRFSSPNKVFEAMMLGKPIVVSKGTNMDSIILDADCGLVVDYGNVDQLEKAFKAIAEDVNLRQRLAQNARLVYEVKYSWKIMTQRLLRLYNQVRSSTYQDSSE